MHITEDRSKMVYSGSQNTGNQEVDPETVFKSYLEKCEKGVVYNSDKLNEALKFLKEKIESNLNTNCCLNFLQFCHMFGFSAENKETWNIKLCMDDEDPNYGEHFYCFNCHAEEGALEIVKTYISLMFEEKIQDIKIEDKQIHILWKPSAIKDNSSNVEKKTIEELKQKIAELERALLKANLRNNNGVVDYAKNFDEALIILKDHIEDLFNKNYDGYHDGKTGPTYSGKSFCHMYEFSADSKTQWQLKLHAGSQDPNFGEQFCCFKPDEEDSALEKVKTYISQTFKEKLQDIKIEDKAIHIVWNN